MRESGQPSEVLLLEVDQRGYGLGIGGPTEPVIGIAETLQDRWPSLARPETHYSNLEIDQIELSNGGSLDQELVLSLDTALRKLEKMDQRAARVIKLKFFAGMNYDEIAEVLTISPATVKRELGSAKCFLYQELKMSQLR